MPLTTTVTARIVIAIATDIASAIAFAQLFCRGMFSLYFVQSQSQIQSPSPGLKPLQATTAHTERKKCISQSLGQAFVK